MTMGSSFDDVLGQYAAPTDYDIVLPGRGVVGNKGGNAPAATAPSAPVETGADAHPAGGTPEPAPQLPEGSDAEEKDAAAEEEAEAERAVAVAKEQARLAQLALVEEPTEAVDAGEDQADAGVAEPASTEAPTLAVAATGPYPVIPRKGSSLSFEGPSVNLKHFPKALIEQMRAILEVQLGEDFARDLSQFSLVTAFVIAAMGSDIQTDQYTAHAVRAFCENDPKTDAIEKRTALLVEQQGKFEGLLKKVSEKMDRVMESADVLEMGQAYALAERTAFLETDGALPETIDVTQKRAVASRDNIRKRVMKLRREEKIRDGRPIR